MLKSLLKFQSGLLTSENFKREEISRCLRNLELLPHQTFEGSFVQAVTSLDIDSVDRYLLSGSSSGQFYIHDLQNHTGKPNFRAKLISTQYHNAKTYIQCISWFPMDSGLFVTSGMDRQLKVWDANRMQAVEKFSFRHGISQHHLDPTHSSLIAVAAGSDVVELVDLRTGSRTHELHGHRSPVLTVQWSPLVSNILASGDSVGQVLLWDARSPKYSTDLLRNKSSGTRKAHDGCAVSLRFASSGHLLLTLGTDRRMRLWNVHDGKNLHVKYPSLQNNAVQVQFSVSTVSKCELAFVPSGCYIQVCEVLSGQAVQILRAHLKSVHSCTLRPTHQQLYTASSDKSVLVWGSRKLDSDAAGTISRTHTIDTDNWSSDEDSL